MKKSVPLKDVHYSYFPRSRRDTAIQGQMGGKHQGQLGGRRSEAKIVRAFMTIVVGTTSVGQEVKQMLGFVV